MEHLASRVHQITISTPLYALIIGINTYPTEWGWEPLSGAVADADSVNNFLTNTLGVEEENIINLRDQRATRTAILEGFDSLIGNDDIKQNDAILIYYAGHGARDVKPEGEDWKHWASNEDQIEMICPVDIGIPISTSNYEPVLGIPDRTIAAKLNELSSLKGNNIIVIFDCCHSAGANRSIPGRSASLKPRCLLNPPRITAECDVDIWSTEGHRAMGTSAGFSGQNQESHIFLAACGREEFAMEDPKTKQGLFTSMLMKALREHGHNDLTYLALIQYVATKIPIYVEQTPHYYGKYVNRRLFNISDAPVDTTMFYGYSIKPRRKTEEFIPSQHKFELFAGNVQGLQKHAEFEIYKTNLLDDPANQPLGVLRAQEVGPLKSTLAFVMQRFHVPRQFYAKEIPGRNTGMVTVYCQIPSFADSLLASGQHIQQGSVEYKTLEDAGVKFVDDLKEAMVEITFKDGRVEFYTTDKRIIQHLGSRIPHDAAAGDMKTIWKVLIALGRFNRFLDTASDAFKNVVHLQLRKLKREKLKGGLPTWFANPTPTGENLVENVNTEGMEGSVDVEVDDAEYGVTLKNDTAGEEEIDLYPYLVYFDACNLSIQDWYLSPLRAANGRLPDAPLRAGKEFGIGHGNGGAVPWAFYLGDGVKMEMGFLKLYVATEPIDIQPIKQPTPFDGGSRSGRSAREVNPPSELWGTQTIVVIQRKKAPVIQEPVTNSDENSTEQ